jgi:hypothetical protein
MLPLYVPKKRKAEELADLRDKRRHLEEDEKFARERLSKLAARLTVSSMVARHGLRVSLWKGLSRTSPNSLEQVTVAIA